MAYFRYHGIGILSCTFFFGVLRTLGLPGDFKTIMLTALAMSLLLVVHDINKRP